jgi:hypothetical protein
MLLLQCMRENLLAGVYARMAFVCFQNCRLITSLLACLCTVQQTSRGSCVTAEVHIKQGTEDMQTNKPRCVGAGWSVAARGVSARLWVASSCFGMTRAGHGLKTMTVEDRVLMEMTAEGRQDENGCWLVLQLCTLWRRTAAVKRRSADDSPREPGGTTRLRRRWRIGSSGHLGQQENNQRATEKMALKRISTMHINGVCQNILVGK